jgi:hypothetical protein
MEVGDHVRRLNSLASALAKSKTSFSPCQQCNATSLPFRVHYTFVHLPGHHNVHVSRHTITAISATMQPPHHNHLQPHQQPTFHLPHPLIFFLCHFLTLTKPRAKAQLTCPSTLTLQGMPSLHITSISRSSQLTLLRDVSTKTFGPLIPIQLQHQIFQPHLFTRPSWH